MAFAGIVSSEGGATCSEVPWLLRDRADEAERIFRLAFQAEWPKALTNSPRTPGSV